MCGLSVVFAYQEAAPPVCERELLAMHEAVRSRGPDGEGLWISADRRIGFAHRRLAILDPSVAGAQPMFDPTGRYAIVFNGQIYNYPELRREIEQSGGTMASNCDTEVLLHLYIRMGERMVERLRGMYAFVIWDRVRRSIFMARDPFGIKPLYYSDDGLTIRIASQVKALLAGGRIDREVQPAGHVGFLLFGSVPEPFTLFRRISSLPSGATLTVGESGHRRFHQFFDVGQEIAEAEAHAANQGAPGPGIVATGELQDALVDSVAHHLLADVPVGIFLSSGIDSATILSLIGQLPGGPKLQAVTLGFTEYRHRLADETALATLIASRFGIDHRVSWLSLAEFRQDHERLFQAMDQPTIDGVNTYFVSKAAAAIGLKVALSGIGGDELFAGYPSFRQIPRLVRALSPMRRFSAVAQWLREVAAPVADRIASPKFAGILEYGTSVHAAYLLRYGVFMPWELPKIIDPDLARAGLADLAPLYRLEASQRNVSSTRLKITALELQWYLRHQLLRDADWAGMAHSIEIRVPLIDIALFRRALRLLVRRGALTKQDLASAPARPLPDAVLRRPKTGFCVPLRDWLLPSSQPLRDRSRSGHRAWAAHVYGNFTSVGAPVNDVEPTSECRKASPVH